MGYRIEYQPVKKVRGMEKRISRLGALTAVCLLLFLLLVSAVWPQGASAVQSFFLPGDAAVTAAALEGLTADLQAGVGWSDALELFCIRVIEGAELDPG